MFQEPQLIGPRNEPPDREPAYSRGGAVMATQPPGGTSGPSPSMSEAEVLLMTIESKLWSLDRTDATARTIEELEQVVADIWQGLRSVSR